MIATWCEVCKAITSWHRKDNDALNPLQCDKCHTQHPKDARDRKKAGIKEPENERR